MNNRIGLAGALVFCGICFISSLAAAEDKWQVTIVPTIGTVAIDGTVQVQHKSADVNYSWDKLKKYVKTGGSLMGEVRKGDHGFFVSGSYVKFGYDGTLEALNNANTDLTTSITSVEGIYVYRFLKGSTYAVDAMAGARYWRFSADIEPVPPHPDLADSYSGVDNWVDPIFGARYIQGLTQKLSFIARGDFGGFGIGSHFTWAGRAGLQYQFTKHISGLVGYDYTHINFSNSSSKLDVNIQGAFAGVGFSL